MVLHRVRISIYRLRQRLAIQPRTHTPEHVAQRLTKQNVSPYYHNLPRIGHERSVILLRGPFRTWALWQRALAQQLIKAGKQPCRGLRLARHPTHWFL